MLLLRNTQKKLIRGRGRASLGSKSKAQAWVTDNYHLKPVRKKESCLEDVSEVKMKLKWTLSLNLIGYGEQNLFW